MHLVHKLNKINAYGEVLLSVYVCPVTDILTSKITS